jgi:hypothetical protein
LVGLSPQGFQKWLSSGNKKAYTGTSYVRLVAVVELHDKLCVTILPGGAGGEITLRAAANRDPKMAKLEGI